MKHALKIAKKEIFYMKRALKLAKKGLGKTKPNPCVGAVLVKNKKIIGEGWHKKAGMKHAEVNAIEDAKKKGNSPEGATLYVTLSPCCHYGKTGPCTDAIVKAKIKRVVAASEDPNPLCKKTQTIFKNNFIPYCVGLLEDEAQEINKTFFKFHRTGLPFLTLKIAMSLNGKITGQKGKYMSSPASQKFVHRLRSQVDGILVGVNTILSDDPHLGVRNIGAKQKSSKKTGKEMEEFSRDDKNARESKNTKDPKRIILDSFLRTPIHCKALRDKNVIIITKIGTNNRLKKEKLGEKAEILEVDDTGDLKSVMKILAKRGLQHILVEGGQMISTSFFNSGLVDQCLFIMAPFAIDKGVDFVKFKEIKMPMHFEKKSIEKLGCDLLLEMEARFSR